MHDLKRKTVIGAAWMVGMRMSVNLLGIFSTFVLARLLTPGDFGIVALAGSAYQFFAVLGQFGFDLALIQMKNPSREHYDTAWTANIIVGLCIAVAMAIVAKPAAAFFSDARIEDVVYSFAALSLAQGFENIGAVNFRKTLAFQGEYFYFVLPKICSFLAGIAAAFAIRNYWALVIGMIVSRAVKLVYSYLAQPYRPRLDLSKFKELFGFTRWILGTRVLQYVSANGLEVILGRLVNPAAVGAFSVARQVGFLPAQELLAPINRALLPSFSKISDDSARVRSAYYQTLGMTALVSVPSAFGILAISHLLVHVALGAQWDSAAPLVAVLGFVGALRTIASPLTPVLLARGLPRVSMVSLAVYVAVVIPTGIVLIHLLGPVGIAYAMLAATILSFPVVLAAARREVGIELRIVARQLWRPLTASIAMGVTVHSLSKELLSQAAPSVSTAVALVLAGIVSYAVYMAVLWVSARRPDGPERSLLDMSVRWFRHLRAGA